MEPKGSEPAKSRVPICRAVIKFLSWQVRKHIGICLVLFFFYFPWKLFGIEDRRIPEEVLYGQLRTGVRKDMRPTLRFKEAL